MLSDCATAERVGAVAERHAELFRDLPRVVIDHHASNDAGGPGDWVDPAAAATCEMVALLAVRLGVPLDAGDGALATALMAGIVMDTATFAHPERDAAHARGVGGARRGRRAAVRHLAPALPLQARRAAAAVRAGAGPAPDVARRTASIWSTLEPGDLEATGALPAHSEGIIDLLAQSETAEVAMLLKGQDDGTTRLSVRTKPGGVDATVLTGAFGGGGHARAAGATVTLPLDEAVVAAVPRPRGWPRPCGR